MDIKKDFPIFRNQPHDWSYLDSGATTQKPKAVIDAVRRFYEAGNANVHRSDYLLARKATEAYEGVRKKVASFINAYSEKEIIFTKNTNESVNIVAQSLRGWISKGDVIVLSRAEHNSNIVPWLRLANQVGAEIQWLELNEDLGGVVIRTQDIDFTRVAIVALTQVSNVTGTILPIKDLIKMFKTNIPKDRDVKFAVDGAQAVGHGQVDMRELDCDYYYFSGHKMYAPSGVGVLYAKGGNVLPLLVGSGMVDDIFIEKQDFVVKYYPDGMEAGTPNLEGVYGLGAAIDYIWQVGWEYITKHEMELIVYALDKFKDLHFQLIGPNFSVNRIGIFSFHYPTIHSHDVAQGLDVANVAVRAGHHCAIPLMKYLNLSGVTRASFGIYTTQKDIDHLVRGLKDVEKFYKV